MQSQGFKEYLQNQFMINAIRNDHQYQKIENYLQLRVHKFHFQNYVLKDQKANQIFATLFISNLQLDESIQSFRDYRRNKIQFFSVGAYSGIRNHNTRVPQINYAGRIGQINYGTRHPQARMNKAQSVDTTLMMTTDKQRQQHDYHYLRNNHQNKHKAFLQLQKMNTLKQILQKQRDSEEYYSMDSYVNDINLLSSIADSQDVAYDKIIDDIKANIKKRGKRDYRNIELIFDYGIMDIEDLAIEDMQRITEHRVLQDEDLKQYCRFSIPDYHYIYLLNFYEDLYKLDSDSALYDIDDKQLLIEFTIKDNNQTIRMQYDIIYGRLSFIGNFDEIQDEYQKFTNAIRMRTEEPFNIILTCDQTDYYLDMIKQQILKDVAIKCVETYRHQNYDLKFERRYEMDTSNSSIIFDFIGFRMNNLDFMEMIPHYTFIKIVDIDTKTNVKVRTNNKIYFQIKNYNNINQSVKRVMESMDLMNELRWEYLY